MKLSLHTASLLNSPCHGYILDYHLLLFSDRGSVCVTTGDGQDCLYHLWTEE